MTGPVLIRGGGEMASGVALVLHAAGYRIAVLETESPKAIRRTVAFAQAVFDGTCQVEHVTGNLISNNDIEEVWGRGEIPVLIDPEGAIRSSHDFPVVVDALMSKRNAGGTTSGWAELVIGLGPGFVAPADCHLVVETLRGHFLGRFYDEGSAIADTGQPGEIGGETSARVIRAPKAGGMEALVTIGQQVEAGDPVASVAGETVAAGLDGVVRGIMATGCRASAGEKIGDIDPRGDVALCYVVSEKARLIGFGVRSAIEWWFGGRPFPATRRPDTA